MNRRIETSEGKVYRRNRGRDVATASSCCRQTLPHGETLLQLVIAVGLVLIMVWVRGAVTQVARVSIDLRSDTLQGRPLPLVPNGN
jgi:hypothetical protein